MANNRMFLTYRPTGDCVYLGKRMGFGWYNVPDNIRERIEKLFELAEESALVTDGFSQDDFAIALESGENQPYVIDKWEYMAELEKGLTIKIKIADDVPYGTSE